MIVLTRVFQPTSGGIQIEHVRADQVLRVRSLNGPDGPQTQVMLVGEDGWTDVKESEQQLVRDLEAQA